MKPFNIHLYDINNFCFDKYHNFYLKKHNFYIIKQISVTNKHIYSINNLLLKNELVNVKFEPDMLVKLTLISLCSILNENKNIILKLKEGISDEYYERQIENMRKSTIVILNFYKEIFGNKYYLDILKDTRNFILLTTVLYEYIKQNNLNFITFNKYYELNSLKDIPELEKIKNAINKIK